MITTSFPFDYLKNCLNFQIDGICKNKTYHLYAGDLAKENIKCPFIGKRAVLKSGPYKQQTITATITNIEPRYLTFDMNNAEYTNWGIIDRFPKPQLSIKSTSTTGTSTSKKVTGSDYVISNTGNIDLFTFIPYSEYVLISCTFTLTVTHDLDTIVGSKSNSSLYIGSTDTTGRYWCPNIDPPLEKGTSTFIRTLDKSTFTRSGGILVSGYQHLYFRGEVWYEDLPLSGTGELSITASVDNIRYYLLCSETGFSDSNYPQLLDGDCHLITCSLTNIVN